MDQAPKLAFGKDARARLIRGANKLAKAVSVTMGPRGQLAVIDDGYSTPHLTKDGVTVANAIKLPDSFENSGAAILRDASRKTASEAGDGTTTTCVLAASIIHATIDALEKNPGKARELFDGLEQALDESLERLEKMRIDVSDVEQIQHVATISANGDKQLGTLISSAIEKLGPSATILIDEARTYETSIEFVDGTEVDRGFVSPHFANSSATNKCRFENPWVVIFNKKLTSLKELLPLLEMNSSSGKPLLLFAEDYEHEVLKGLIMNKQRGSISVCACKLPEFGNAAHESAYDLAALFGCDVVCEADFQQGTLVVKNEHIGHADVTETTKSKTTVLRPNTNAARVNERNEAIVAELEESVSSDRNLQLKRRQQRLKSGIAVLRVGAATEVELQEKLDRVDDAVNATRVAAMHGILPGGGSALFRIALELDSHKKNREAATQAAFSAFSMAIKAPLRVIVENACYNIKDVAKSLTYKFDNGQTDIGFNANTGEYVNLIHDGVIDPFYVTKSSLINALSVAKKILEVGCVINHGYEQFEDENV
jgi:chaperonin GroEL